MAKIKQGNKLPKLIQTKIYKTGQTRGADDDVIFQNRVNRNSTVLIPYSIFSQSLIVPDNKEIFENGFIVLIKPALYFENKNFAKEIKLKGLIIGKNALLFYETREQWNQFNPEKHKLKPATSRKNPLNGEYVARVPSTTSNNHEKINRGFTTSGSKGAGIRIYEYANDSTIKNCMVQLEYLYWLCSDSKEVSLAAGMTIEEIEFRIAFITAETIKRELADHKLLREVRIIDVDDKTVCPLCLEKLSAKGFYNRLLQALGRDVPDLTVTQLNLFHIQELRIGEYNHRPYNLGWGHHHCNVVTKDAGIIETLKWMVEIIDRNELNGHKIRRTD